MGSLVFADGSSYEGSWADDRREGQGVFKTADGEIYDGHWHSDKVCFRFDFALIFLLHERLMAAGLLFWFVAIWKRKINQC
jgi:hypothetical protein